MKPRRRGRTRALTPKAARFIAEYLIDLNAADAARRAGYSLRTADKIGWNLLQRPRVRALIASGQRTQLARADLTAARVLEELRRVVFANLASYYQPDGSLRPLHTLTAEEGSALGGVETCVRNIAGGDDHQDTVIKVKLVPKDRVLELALKHLGLIRPDTLRLEADWEKLAARLASARKRDEK